MAHQRAEVSSASMRTTLVLPPSVPCTTPGTLPKPRTEPMSPAYCAVCAVHVVEGVETEDGGVAARPELEESKP